MGLNTLHHTHLEREESMNEGFSQIRHLMAEIEATDPGLGVEVMNKVADLCAACGRNDGAVFLRGSISDSAIPKVVAWLIKLKQERPEVQESVERMTDELVHSGSEEVREERDFEYLTLIDWTRKQRLVNELLCFLVDDRQIGHSLMHYVQDHF